MAGGNARDRRRARRLVQSILRTYGYLPKGAKGQAEKPQSRSEFFYKYLLPAVALAGFGLKVAESSPVVASVAYLLAIGVFFRGFLAWCDTQWKMALLSIAVGTVFAVFVWRDYKWITEEWTASFLYLVPTHELIDCERRAFFVNHLGPKAIQNVKIVIKDNKSGTVWENDDYKAGIEPGPQNPDAPRYIWVKPSNPWNEDYTITVTGTNFRSTQEMVLRSVRKQAQFAVEISTHDNKRPVASCRDSLLPSSYSLAQGSRGNCTALMAVNPKFLDRLQSTFNGFQDASGDYTVVRMRMLPSPSDLDSQSDDRHVTEYEQAIMRSKLSKYRGTKLLVFYGGGSKTLAYATELRNLMRSIGWSVEGPRLVPVGDERIADIQISISNQYWNVANARAADLLSSLEGAKHREKYVYDNAIPPDMIVLWVGPKSPANFRPDDCAPAELRPRPGEHHTCEMVSQAPHVCPFPPQ